jgi:hypothetical protein
MAQQALGAGTAVPRKRVMFGLLDADGWGWASVKAFTWLIIIIFMLGYIPDRAYYLTVNRTVDLGILAWSPVNLCPPENRTLPCPAPIGAVVPWEPSPAQISLPAPRTDGAAIQTGTQVLFIGGSDGQTAQADVYVARISGGGNFDSWTAGPALPEPRSNASVIASGGTIYVFGGLDADGAPTTSAFILSPDSMTGELGEWSVGAADVTLPEPRSGAAIAATPDGLLLIGGSDENGPVTSTWKSSFDDLGNLGPWTPEAPLVTPQTDALAAVIGDHVWLYGGSDASGPVGAVQRGDFGEAAAPGLPENPDEGRVVQWRVANEINLPAARTNASGWTASGAIYLVGGRDATGTRGELYWAIPDSEGLIPEWKRLEVSDLPAEGLEGAAAVVSGPNVILIGGRTSSGVLASGVRANIAPQAPFFQLGLVGATVPALKIEGEIGQQLGYLNAAGAGTVNFILLILLGLAFNNKERSRALLGRAIGRFRRSV